MLLEPFDAEDLRGNRLADRRRAKHTTAAAPAEISRWHVFDHDGVFKSVILP
jgi:hypothetical protein